ncbi:MAG: 1,4-dihydroxy-2-naphthoate polyprenyltransferase [Peptococcaceae bacterium]
MPVNAPKEQTVKQASWQVWWLLLRPHTLTAAFVPVLIGTVFALKERGIDFLLFGAMLTASLLIQTATNMFNEYYDFKRGLDTAESVGIGGTIVRYGISPRTVLGIALAFYASALLLGLYICLRTSFVIALVGVLCMAVGYLYTGGPYPIAYTPFGELFAGFFMGPVIILISFYIQTGLLNWHLFLLSVPPGILIGAILMSNNIRDLDGDKESGRKTLAILLGKSRAVGFLAGMFTISYLWIAGLVISGVFSPWLLLVFLTLPHAGGAVRGFRSKSLPAEMMLAMAKTAKLNTLFGFMVAIGLIISLF